MDPVPPRAGWIREIATHHDAPRRGLDGVDVDAARKAAGVRRDPLKVAVPLASEPPRVVPERLGHWAWLPALFCLLLTTLVDAPLLRVVLGLIGAGTLAGGYAYVAALSSAPPAHRVRLEAAAAWLPGVYAAIAVGAHLGVTAYVAIRGHALRDIAFESASLAPWSPVVGNLRASPLAPAAAARLQVLGGIASPPPVTSAERAARRGQLLAVGPGGYPDLSSAIAAAAAGDTIRIAAGRYPGPRVTIDKDLAIEGAGPVTLYWRGGRGPYLRVAGRGTRVTFSHLRLEAVNVNTAVVGDPNLAYGEPASGAGQQVVLRDVEIDAPQSSAIYSTSPGARYLIEGGQYRTAGTAIIMINGGALSIRPYRGTPTRISSDGSSGVAGNAMGLHLVRTARLSIDGVVWSGNPGGDVAIAGNVEAVALRHTADLAGAQRVILVDDQGAPTGEYDLPAEVNRSVRFSVLQGAVHALGPAPGDPSDLLPTS